MPSLDVFKADAFSMASLTAAINALPYQPKMIGASGLFKAMPIVTTTALIEKREGRLSVLQTAGRGTMPTVEVGATQAVRSLVVPHIPANATVRADDVQNVRAFGSETELETVSGVVNDKLMVLRGNHEVTFEWHRMGAIKGIILDANGALLYNLFDEFEVVEQTVDFNLGDDAAGIKAFCTETVRLTEDALGADTYSELVVWCGNAWWDAFIAHPNVVAAYANWTAASQMSTQQRAGFPFGGLTFKNYRGKIGSQEWMPAVEARVCPYGVGELFQHIMAPGDMIDTVNTRGQAIYAKQEVLPFGKGIEIHTQSNPLMLCTRPECLIKLTATGVVPFGAKAPSTKAAPTAPIAATKAAANPVKK